MWERCYETLVWIVEDSTVICLLRDDHEFLEGKTATSVGTTVQDVLERNGENIWLLGSGKVGNVSVERDALLSSTSLGNGQ